jgi:hypothetical protein
MKSPHKNWLLWPAAPGRRSAMDLGTPLWGLWAWRQRREQCVPLEGEWATLTPGWAPPQEEFHMWCGEFWEERTSLSLGTTMTGIWAEKSAKLGWSLFPTHYWRSGLYKQLACHGCCDIQLFCCRCHCSSPSLEVLEMPTLGLMQLKSYLKKLEARKFISLSTWELWRRWLSYWTVEFSWETNVGPYSWLLLTRRPPREEVDAQTSPPHEIRHRLKWHPGLGQWCPYCSILHNQCRRANDNSSAGFWPYSTSYLLVRISVACTCVHESS